MEQQPPYPPLSESSTVAAAYHTAGFFRATVGKHPGRASGLLVALLAVSIILLIWLLVLHGKYKSCTTDVPPPAAGEKFIRAGRRGRQECIPGEFPCRVGEACVVTAGGGSRCVARPQARTSR